MGRVPGLDAAAFAEAAAAARLQVLRSGGARQDFPASFGPSSSAPANAATSRIRCGALTWDPRRAPSRSRAAPNG